MFCVLTGVVGRVIIRCFVVRARGCVREYGEVLGRRSYQRVMFLFALFLSVSLTLGGVADVNMWNSAACTRWGY